MAVAKLGFIVATRKAVRLACKPDPITGRPINCLTRSIVVLLSVDETAMIAREEKARGSPL